jgi:putative ABC transport system substrate-binding protein
MILRREFIAALGGAAVWSVAVQAQRPTMPVVGFVHLRPSNMSAQIVAAFDRGLRETGYVDGVNVTVEYHFADGRNEDVPVLLGTLIRRPVSVIVAGPRVDVMAKAATDIIPIVFLNGSDPVRTGLVASLNRPGGNATGVSTITSDLETKRLGLIHDLLPQARTIGVLVDSNAQEVEERLQALTAAGRAVGLTTRITRPASEHDFDTAFAALARERVEAMFVMGSAAFIGSAARLTALAARHGIPAVYELREYAEAGGLMSYGPSNVDLWHQVGRYTGRILKGERPADLPVELPTRFELIINLKTARALRLEIPPLLLALADEVIE